MDNSPEDEFKKAVIDSLTKIQTRQVDIESQLALVTEIVTMGRAVFKLAYWVGQAAKWILSISAAAILLFNVLHWGTKDIPK